MRVPWKIIGLAGVAGVASGAVVVRRRRRGQQEYDPEALRAKLHERLAESRGGAAAGAVDEPERADVSPAASERPSRGAPPDAPERP